MKNQNTSSPLSHITLVESQSGAAPSEKKNMSKTKETTQTLHLIRCKGSKREEKWESAHVFHLGWACLDPSMLAVSFLPGLWVRLMFFVSCVSSQVVCVNSFSQMLRRYTSLNHLAQAAHAVLQNSAHINQMLSDLNRVDFNNVQVCISCPVCSI